MSSVSISSSDPATIATEMVRGLPYCLPAVKVVPEIKVAVRADYEDHKKSKRVALISGGGSGHEPAHAGYIGEGMLTGAVAGNVFASPSTSAVLQGILTVTGDAGCLVIVKNYTGDRLNFGLAVQQAKFQFGKNVDMVIVGDDAALKRSAMGRRGVAGTVLVHKIAGAAAARGHSLSDVKRVAEAVTDNMATMAVSFSPVLIPGTAMSDEFKKRLEGHMMELGMGIHGEPGAKKVDRAACPCAAGSKGDHVDVTKIAETLLQAVFNDDNDFGYLSHRQRGQKAALLINSLGASIPMELSLLAGVAVKIVEQKYHLKVTRTITGPLMTSLNMPGASLTVLLLDDERESLLDAPTTAGLPPVVKVDTSQAVEMAPHEEYAKEETVVWDKDDAKTKLPGLLVKAACSSIVSAEPEITRMDTICGDGDCGTGLKRAAESVLRHLEKEDIPLHTPDTKTGVSAPLFATVGRYINEGAEGSSGALYNILFTATAAALKRLEDEKSPPQGIRAIGMAVKEGIDKLCEIGGAQPGMRTMIDALTPACDALAQAAGKGPKAALEAAAKAAQEGAEATKTMDAVKGRASYIPAEQMKGTADPGAYAVSVWFKALADAYTD